MFIRLILCLITFHFSPTLLSAQKAEPVKRITQAQRSGAYYSQQTKAWKEITKADPQNADAWLQYFTAARYSNIFNGGAKIDLEEIVAQLVKVLPNSFEANYLTFHLKPWESASFQYLEKAYAIDPSNPITYQAFINHYLISEEKNKFKEFCVKHYQSTDHSPGLLSWSYNAMVNLEPEAIIITEGDNDTYPLWILQEAKAFRTDVAVININLLINEDYRAITCKQLGIKNIPTDIRNDDAHEFKNTMLNHIIDNTKRPIYLSIGVPQSIRDAFKEDLQIVGLSFKIDKTSFDNIAILKKSYEQLFQMDYIEMSMQEDPCQEALDQFSRSYLPSMFKLYEYYQAEEETIKAKELASLITLIGEKSNALSETEKILAKYKKLGGCIEK